MRRIFTLLRFFGKRQLLTGHASASEWAVAAARQQVARAVALAAISTRFGCRHRALREDLHV